MIRRRIVISAVLLALVAALPLVRTARAATITVTTHLDTLDAGANCAAVTLASLPGPDGVTSLREAICAANNNPVEDTINFNIPGAGVQTIDLLSALPQLVGGSTTIDGYTQFGAAPATDATPATLLVAVDGTGIINNGFNVTSSGNLIRGLAIYGFAGSEIYIANFGDAVANDNVIAGNYLGSDASGLACPLPANAGLNGVFIGEGAQNNTIGGDAPAERNLILCNGWEGVGIHGSDTTGNVVSGNYIGVDPRGTTTRANSLDGVRIYGGAHDNVIGGDMLGERNIIAGNERDGVHMVGTGVTGNHVLGNTIGLEPDGVSARGNDFFGVYLGNGAQGNLIGGDAPAERNIISGNLVGVVISGTTTTDNTISGNYIGTDSSGQVDVGNDGEGVAIIGGAHHNTLGGAAPGAGNLISGNDFSGVLISCEGTPGTEGNVVRGNYIGTDAAGLANLGNGHYGVRIENGAQNNIVGGDRTAGEGNIISGNGAAGVSISDAGTDGNQVAGNFIGTDASGLVALGNHSEGARLSGDLHNNVIGGDTAGERNVISGNSADGITFTSSAADNIVSGNYIGLGADGATPLPNGNNGVDIGSEAHGNTIGGDTVGERNVIAANGRDGITVEGDDNVITGNFIGTDAGGMNARGNAGHGVYLSGSAIGNVIGGGAPGEGNLISGNGDEGVALDSADDNTVSGNKIGVNVSGSAALANGGFGVLLGDAQGNTIGGATRAEGNIISGNFRDGIYVSGDTAAGNVIANNSIGTTSDGATSSGNGENGIELDFGAHDNIIGPGNVVAFNNSAGVFVQGDAAVGNTISQNRIFANVGSGISLTTGANGGILAPQIGAASFVAGEFTVSGTACAGCTVELFGNSTNDGEGEFYLGSTAADGSGAFNLALALPPHPSLTATATDTTNGTSEFSVSFVATAGILHLPLVVR